MKPALSIDKLLAEIEAQVGAPAVARIRQAMAGKDQAALILEVWNAAADAQAQAEKYQQEVSASEKPKRGRPRRDNVEVLKKALPFFGEAQRKGMSKKKIFGIRTDVRSIVGSR